MPNYRRAKIEGGTYFFTVVTDRRKKILCLTESRRVLCNTIIEVKKDYPFSIDAWVLLPDHIHCIWTLPRHDCDFSKRWGLIKARFTKRVKRAPHQESWVNASKRKHREATIWQRRFWEHRIRDDNDFTRHVDYIHYNPVKHGYVDRVSDWPYSTFHRFVRSGVYSTEWARGQTIIAGDEFGE
jgi:putative transposase